MFRLRPVYAAAFALGACAATLPAFGEIYKYVDERGHVTYSNKPIKGGQKVELPEISTVPAVKVEQNRPTRPAATDTTEQQRQALKERIAAAEKALEEAKRAYREGAENPEVWQRRDAQGNVVARGRNMAAYEEKMKRLQEEVDRRQKELDDLRGQLSALEGSRSLSAPPRGEQPR